MGDNEQPWMRHPAGGFDTGGTAAQIERMLIMHGHHHAARLVAEYFIKERVHTAIEMIVDDAAMHYARSPEDLSRMIGDRLNGMVEGSLLDLPKNGGSLTNLHGEMVEGRDHMRFGTRYEFHLFADRLDRGQQTYAQRAAEQRGLPEGTVIAELIDE
jgi:hypothetical protein